MKRLEGIPKMKNLKIMHIIPLFHGGVGTVVYNLTKEFAKKGIKLVLASLAKPSLELLGLGVVYYVLKRPLSKDPLYVLEFYALNIETIKDILNREKPDVILTHGPLVIIARAIHEVPIVSIVHGTYANEVKWMWNHPIFGAERVKYIAGIYTTHKFDTSLYRLLTRSGNVYLVAVSRNTRRELIDAGALPNKVFSILNGVDKDVFKPMNKERARALVEEWFGVELGDKVLLHVNPGPRKGTHMLIKAIAQLKKLYGRDFTLLIIGRLGPKTYKEYVEEMIRGLRLEENVKTLGYVENERLPIIYNSADLAIVPSYSEGAPLVIPESLACGTPVVATNVGGNFDYLKLVHSENFVIEIKQYDFSKGLAFKIFEALMTSSKELNCDAIPRWNDVAKAYLSIFESLLR